MFLEQGKTRAIRTLLTVPNGEEVSFANAQDRDVWLGLGWLIGRGWVQYTGNYHFCFSATGRKACESYLADA